MKGTIAIPVISMIDFSFLGSTAAAHSVAGFRRVRPADPDWPSAKEWEKLNHEVNGSLIKIESPLENCRIDAQSNACLETFRELRNPYFIGDQPALTQSSGWLDAWTTAPSVFAVAAKNTGDLVAAVNFARNHRLRLVVKGGGHSYQGTSNAPDSLLVWTRAMNQIELQDQFVPAGCEGKQEPQYAVSLGAGAIWMHAYDAVTVKGGRYVQGGGCGTVGVAGLIQSGGFGSHSKNYGLAAAALLEAEIVTADGKLLVVNDCQHSDLFWGLKGGGGGSLGVITRLTLKTRELPAWFGAASGTIKAKSDESFKSLISRAVAFYNEKLFNPHWGEQLSMHGSNRLLINMNFQGFDGNTAKAQWQSFLDWVNSSPQDYAWEKPLSIQSLPPQHMWDAAFFNKYATSAIVKDDRPNAPIENIFWSGNQEEVGIFWHAYHSAWLPVSLLAENRQKELADALFAASRYWTVGLHFNKGLAGAPPQEIEAARNTATNPSALDAFALAIIAGGTETGPAVPGIAGHEPDLQDARHAKYQIDKAMEILRGVAPDSGSYLSESNYFESDWQQSFWGSNYTKLAAVKKKYDPEGLFFVHHGVGSEDWSEDGFTRRK